MEKKVMGEPLVWVVLPLAQKLFMKHLETLAPGETNDVRAKSAIEKKSCKKIPKEKVVEQ
jgi:hypothetical protein